MLSIIIIIEVLWFCLGGSLFAYRSSRRVSEAISLGIILALMLLSVIFQVSFLLKIPRLSFVLEFLFSILIFFEVKHRYLILKEIVFTIKDFFNKHKILSSIIFICCLYLFLLAIIIPPANWDSMTYNLARNFLFQQENSVLLKSFTTPRQALFVVGSDILNHAFLRFYSDYGVGLFSFLAYVSVGLGTYALSRNFASVKISLAATLIIISMPEFCFQATSTKNDIFTAASAVFCLISAYRILEKLDIQDLSFIILGLAFGFSAKSTFLAFLVPYTIIFGYLIIKKYGFWEIFKLIHHNWLYFLILTSPALIMSQLWLLFNNSVYFSDPMGNKAIKIVTKKDDILEKGLANLVRYLFQNIHLFPVDYIVDGRLGINIDGHLTDLYNAVFKPLFGNKAMGYAHGRPYLFSVKSIPHEDFSWYGLAGSFIILPAILFSFFKGNSFLKATSLTLICFMLILSFTLYWTPWNNRYVVLFFAASGICVSFFLQSTFLQNKKLLAAIFVIFTFIFFSSCTLNAAKPFNGVSIKEFFKPSIWLSTNFGTNRLYYADKRYGDNTVKKVKELIAEGSKVALVASSGSWIYHFYLVNPQVKIEPISFNQFEKNALSYNYLLCLDTDCELSQSNFLYKNLLDDSDTSKKRVKLIKIMPRLAK